MMFKGGLNNNFHKGTFTIYDRIYFCWKLTTFELNDVISVMENVAKKYNYKIEAPEDEDSCIVLKFE